MIDPGQVREGMTVRDAQGRRLGKVAHVGDTHFELEQGSPPLRDYAVRFHQVSHIQEGDVYLAPSRASVVPEEELLSP